MRWIDSHIHLDFPQFDADRAQVIERARRAGMIAAVLPGTEYTTWPRLKTVANAETELFPAYGLHPYFIERHQDTHLRELENWLRKEAPVAVGECGLDYYLPNLDRDRQRHYFVAQLALAAQYDLPVIIHARKAVDEVTGLIKDSGCRKGVLHSYGGSLQQARRLMDLGFLMSFGGAVTWPRSRRLHELVAALPLESIMLETDAPDQPPEGHQGQRNEPAYITVVLNTIAKLHDTSPERVAQVTTQNTIRLFSLPETL